MSCQFLACLVISSRVMSGFVIFSRAASCHVLSCPASFSWHLFSRPVLVTFFFPYDVLPCHARRCHVISSRVLSCHACHVLSSLLVSCFVVLFHASPVSRLVPSSCSMVCLAI